MCALGRKRQRLPKVGAPHPFPAIIGWALEGGPLNAASSTPGDIIALLSPQLADPCYYTSPARPVFRSTSTSVDVGSTVRMISRILYPMLICIPRLETIYRSEVEERESHLDSIPNAKLSSHLIGCITRARQSGQA